MPAHVSTGVSHLRLQVTRMLDPNFAGELGSDTREISVLATADRNVFVLMRMSFFLFSVVSIGFLVTHESRYSLTLMSFCRVSVDS